MIENYQNEAPIIQAIYKLYFNFHIANQKFNKQARYTVGQTSENLILEILKLTILAYRKPKIEQLVILEKIDASLEVLRLNVRLIWQLGYLKNNGMVEFQKNIQEIGKMLGGWIKARRIA